MYQNLMKNSGDDVNSTVYFTKETLCDDYEVIDRFVIKSSKHETY